jgi:hypothetical protein
MRAVNPRIKPPGRANRPGTVVPGFSSSLSILSPFSFFFRLLVSSYQLLLSHCYIFVSKCTLAEQLSQFVVLSVDEKSQIQALDRTQPGRPLKKGRGQTVAHDHTRNGTTTLFAALNTANGEVYGLCQQKHHHQEWLKLLRIIDQTESAGKDMRAVLRSKTRIEWKGSAAPDWASLLRAWREAGR